MSTQPEPKYIVHNSSVHTRFEHRNMVGYRPEAIALPVVQELPAVRWTGTKIPVALWRQVLAFFKWSYDTTHSESQVRLFYNFKTGEWKAHAFPQERGTGMTTKEIEDHPNRAEDMKQFVGFDGWGTVHHHCACGAFASGTDKSDEESQAGLHITVGHMDEPEHDLHSRVTIVIPGELDGEGNCIRQAQKLSLAPKLLDWFALPDAIATALPPELHPLVVKHYVTTAAKPDESFPDRWKQNVIERPVVPVYRHYLGGLPHQLHVNGGHVPNGNGAAATNGSGAAIQTALALARRGHRDLTDQEITEGWQLYMDRGWSE